MGEVLLEWKDHDKDLSNKLREFFMEDYLVDFSVTCHGQQLKVHKFVLALLFPMLKESFRASSINFPFDHEDDERNEAKETTMLPTPECLNLDNIADHAEDMDYIIQFVYDGKITVPEEHADCLMHIAETMEIKSLKESLSQWHEKRKLAERIEPIDAAPLSRLRPRAQLKKISENVDIVSCDEDDDDLDLNSSEDSSMCNSLDIDDSSEDDRIGKHKKMQSKQKKVSQKRRSEDDLSKKKSVQRQKTTETPLKETKTDANNEANNGTPLQKQATASTDDKEKKNVKCHQCDYVAKFPSRLQLHLKSHATKPKKVAIVPKMIICKTCNKNFQNSNALYRHRATKCGTELFTCKYCGLKTPANDCLQRHIMARHKVDKEGNPLKKNVKCPQCDYLCYARHQLRNHLNVKHKRANKFKCKECNFTAPYMAEVQRHERNKHQNIRDYMCEECGCRFKSNTSLNNHVLIQHKGMKPHKCNICNVEYSSLLSFNVHMQGHNGKVVYKFVCHVCGHNLRRRFELRSHLRKKHGLEMEESITKPCHLQDAVEPTTT